MKDRSAFTMIELLVVVTIISILTSILLPVFLQAKAAAKQTVCIAHTRQIGLALIMYTTDHDDMWAPASSVLPLSGFSPQQTWIGYDNNNTPLNGGFTGRVDQPALNPPRPGAIDAYINNEQIKVCPNQPGEWQLAVAYNWFNPSFPSAYFTTNPAALGNEFGPGAAQVIVDANGYSVAIGVNDSMIQDHGDTLVTWEHHAHVPLCNFLQGYDWEESPPLNIVALKEHFNFLHRDGTVTQWADGHTSRMVFGRLKRRMFSVRKDIY